MCDPAIQSRVEFATALVTVTVFAPLVLIVEWELVEWLLRLWKR